MLIIITGPTASGKTIIAETLARRIGSEIVSADSRTRYRLLKIGTGRNDLSDDIAYHIIDDLGPDEFSSSYDWCTKARVSVSAIQKKGAIPIICGGSVHLVQTFIDGMREAPPPDPELRAVLKREAEANRPHYLHDLLFDLDPKTASSVHPNNTNRIIRYIERSIGTDRVEGIAPFDRPYILFSTYREREELNGSIRSRTGRMVKDGWVEEVRKLLAEGHSPGSPMFTSTGYHDVIDHISGLIDIGEMERSINSNTIALSRKQIRWGRKHGAKILDLSGTQDIGPIVDDLSILAQQDE